MKGKSKSERPFRYLLKWPLSPSMRRLTQLRQTHLIETQGSWKCKFSSKAVHSAKSGALVEKTWHLETWDGTSEQMLL